MDGKYYIKRANRTSEKQIAHTVSQCPLAFNVYIYVYVWM